MKKTITAKTIADFKNMHRYQISKIYELLPLDEQTVCSHSKLVEILFREFNEINNRSISLRIPIGSNINTYTLVKMVIDIIPMFPLKYRNIKLLEKLFKYGGVIHHTFDFRGNVIEGLFKSLDIENRTIDGFISIIKAFDNLALHTFALGGWEHLRNIKKEFNKQKQEFKTGEIFLELTAIYQANKTHSHWH